MRIPILNVHILTQAELDRRIGEAVGRAEEAGLHRSKMQAALLAELKERQLDVAVDKAKKEMRQLSNVQMSRLICENIKLNEMVRQGRKGREN